MELVNFHHKRIANECINCQLFLTGNVKLYPHNS